MENKTVYVMTIRKYHPIKIKAIREIKSEIFYIRRVDNVRAGLVLISDKNRETEYIYLSELRWGTSEYHLALARDQKVIYLVTNVFLGNSTDNINQLSYGNFNPILNTIPAHFDHNDYNRLYLQTVPFNIFYNIKCLNIKFCITESIYTHWAADSFIFKKYPIPLRKILLLICGYDCDVSMFATLNKDIIFSICIVLRQIIPLLEYKNV